MSNIVSLDARRMPVVPMEVLKAADSPITPEVGDIMYDIYVWADSQGINTNTREFKFQTAAISAILQGVIHGKN